MAKAPVIDKVVKGIAITDARGETDTIRLWESYRDQAALWRALALFQIPTSFILVVFSAVLWASHSVILNVPAKPLPGTYAVKEIPDTEFVQEATSFINLIATYQPYVARRQFTQAREMLFGTVIETFNTDMMDAELQAIENTSRAQVFFADPTKTKVERTADKLVMVTFTGERQKFISGKELPLITSRFSVTMGALPRQRLNPYGIVVTNVSFENVDKKVDKEKEKEEKRKPQQ